MGSLQYSIISVPVAAAAAEQPEQGLQIVIIAPDHTLVNTPVIGLGVDPVEKQAVGLGQVPRGVMLGQGQDGPGQRGLVDLPPGVGQGQMLKQLGDAAADDGGGGAVPRLLPLGEAQVPAAHAVLRQALQVVVQQLAGGVQERAVPGVPVAQGEAVHTPALASGPAGFVAVALGGAAEAGRAGVHVHIKGVVRGPVRADQIFLGLSGVAVGHLPIAAVAGQPRGLVQQRQVEQTVNNHAAPVFGVVQVAPGLNDPCLGEEPAAQGLSRLEETLLRPAVVLQKNRRIAGQRVEEAQIVGIQVAGVLDPVVEAVQVLFQYRQIDGVAGVLIEQPEHPGEEGRGPLKVLLLRGIDQSLRVGGGEAVLEAGQQSREFFLTERQLFLEKVLGNYAGKGEMLHVGHSFSEGRKNKKGS